MISCPAVKVEDASDSRIAGQFSIDTARTSFIYVCPGCKYSGGIHIDGKGPPKQNWDLTGTDEKPTLKPSLNHVGCWHGWLTNGLFTAC